MILMEPATPADASPVFNRTYPEFPPEELPVLSRTIPDVLPGPEELLEANTMEPVSTVALEPDNREIDPPVPAGLVPADKMTKPAAEVRFALPAINDTPAPAPLALLPATSVRVPPMPLVAEPVTRPISPELP